MNTPSLSPVHLLLSRADTGLPFLTDGLNDLEGLPAPQVGDRPDILLDVGKDPQSLPYQRWGIVAPKGDRGARLLDLIRPLIERRARQQEDKEVRIERVDPVLSMDEAMDWKRRNWNLTSSDARSLPRYQLILGDLHEVPLSVQQALALDGFTGRLAFDADEDYRAYAEKVLRWEDDPAPTEQGDAILFTADDGSASTVTGHELLVKPNLAKLQRAQTLGHLKAASVLEGGGRGTDAGRLLDMVQHSHRPTVLFSLSHGDGAPVGGWPAGEQAKALQGAMRFGPGRRLAAEDLPDKPFLPGGIWFMFACYGAGTPEQCAYTPWLQHIFSAPEAQWHVARLQEALPKPGERPFVAALPKRLLAAEHGPLAFLGHVDLAWSYSFEELDQGGFSRAGRFLGALRSLIEGERVGVALHELLRGGQDLSEHLAYLREKQGAADATQAETIAHIALAKEDLRSYILLGDPAARLPIR